MSAIADIYERIILSASAGNAIGTIENVARSLSGGLLKGVSNLAFGFKNLGVAGTIGTDALKLGAVQAGTALWKVAGIAALVGIGIATYIGVKSVEAAGKFQGAILSLVAHAGLAKDQVDRVSTAILAMSTEVGRSPTQLAEAMYPILSAFSNITNQSAKTDLALHTLKLSFQAVAGTTVNGTAVANAAVGTFNALGLATNNAALNAKRMTGLMDIMDLTVQQGNMQWDAYKNVISKLAVSIQGTGIKFTEASAALATMTNMGYSAQRAQTYLSNTFTTLAIKTDALAKHAAKLGIEFDKSKYGPMSLADKIQYLNQITDGNKQKLLALMGNNATALKTFNALSVGIDGYKNSLNGLNHAQGALASSFATASKGFDFQMSQIKAAGQVLLVTIGTALLPVLSKLAAQVTPLITQFTQWLVKSGALKTAVQIFATALGGLITGLVATVQFFQHNEVAMAALQATLIALAFVVGTLMVIALISAAGAFLTMEIAGAPVFAIILAIIAVITIVILVITHWGQIAHWLQGIWGAFSGWFMGIMGKIGAFFVEKWLWMQAMAQAITMQIHAIIQAGFQRIKDAVLMPITAVVGFFKWLYDHNYYFQHLVDKIREIFTVGFAWLTGQWNRFTGWLGGLWDGLKNKASEAWGNISGTINHSTAQTGDNLKSGWGKFAGYMQNAWKGVQTIVGVAWSAYIYPGLLSLGNFLVSWWQGWPSKMFQFGVNMIQGFINGIGSMLGNVGQMAQNVMGKVASIMGFHSPAKEGPGKELDIWGPNLIKGFTQGMLKALPELQSSLNLIMTPVQRSLTMAEPRQLSSPPVSNRGGGGGNVFNFNGSITVHAPGRARNEAQDIADTVKKELAREFMRQSPGFATGGVH